MSFTRDDVKAHESQAAVQVEDKKFNPWNPVVEETPPAVEPEVKAESSAAETSPSDESETVDGSTADTQAAPATAEVATESVTEDEAPHGGKNSARERIQELVDERNALRKYGEYLLDQMRAKQTQPQAEATPEVKEDKMPTMAEFNFDPEAFGKALGEWTQRSVDKRVSDKLQEQEIQRSAAAARESFYQRTDAFKAKHPDYELVISNPALPKFNDNTIPLIFKSEMGPDIVYHLAKNPDKATRIAKMGRDEQAIAIGRLEAELTQPAPVKEAAKPVPVKRTVTQAPPPPKPVTSGTSVSEKPDNMLTMDEFVAKERARKLSEMENKRKIRLAMSKG